jgi:hypothetical protein
MRLPCALPALQAGNPPTDRLPKASASRLSLGLFLATRWAPPTHGLIDLDLNHNKFLRALAAMPDYADQRFEMPAHSPAFQAGSGPTGRKKQPRAEAVRPMPWVRTPEMRAEGAREPPIPHVSFIDLDLASSQIFFAMDRGTLPL